jgi:hypothetical protein
MSKYLPILVFYLFIRYCSLDLFYLPLSLQTNSNQEPKPMGNKTSARENPPNI